MYSRTPLPSIVRHAAPSALVAALVFALVASPALAANGSTTTAPAVSATPAAPADGSALVPGAAVANAALSVGIAPQPAAQEPQAGPAEQARPAKQAQEADLPDLRAATARDSEIIKNLVYDADGRQEPGQRQPYELSLLDAVEMALRNNLSVQVQRYGPQSAFEQIRGSRSSFDPQLQFTIPQRFSRGSSPSTTQIQGADVITQQGLSGGFSWSEQLEWGTSYGLSWSSSRNSSNSEFSTFNPSFSSNVGGNVTQPLLQGFGDVNRTGILVAMNSYDQSLEQFRFSVQNVIAQVVQAYWNLRSQAEGLGVREEALRLAEQQFERNEIQVEIGTLAPIEMVQAETSVANNELSLLRARNDLETAQDVLKELINFDTVVDDPFAYDLVATEVPEQTVPPIDADEAIRVALENDPQLVQQRIGLRSTELNLAQAENNLLPTLNVNATFNLSGRGGTRIIRGGLGGEETQIIETGFGTALSQAFSGDFNTWTLGATLQFPLHNHAAKAAAARTRISQRQQLLQVEQARQQITYDIRQQVRNLENLVQQVATATRTRELAQRQHEAERRKFEVGTTTNFQVLQFQQDLASAQLNEVTAVISLQTAIAQLELTKGTLLQYFGVQIGDAGTGGRESPARLPGPINGSGRR